MFHKIGNTERLFIMFNRTFIAFMFVCDVLQVAEQYYPELGTVNNVVDTLTLVFYLYCRLRTVEMSQLPAWVRDNI